MGSDYVQIRFAHRALLGLPLLHDSIITPTLKYQTAAVGSRRKESHTGTYMNRMSMCSCFFHDTSAKLAHHCVKRKIFNQQGIPSVSVNLLTLFCSKEGFLLTRLNYESREEGEHDPNILHNWCKLILCIAKHHRGYLKKHLCVV